MSPEKNASSAWSRSLAGRLAAALAVLSAGLVAAAHFTGGANRPGVVHLTSSSSRQGAGQPRKDPAAAAAPAFFGTLPPGATLPSSARYVPGDAWGCVGRWFSGRWHDAGAQQYIAKVKQYRQEKIWTTRDFQEP